MVAASPRRRPEFNLSATTAQTEIHIFESGGVPLKVNFEGFGERERLKVSLDAHEGRTFTTDGFDPLTTAPAAYVTVFMKWVSQRTLA